MSFPTRERGLKLVAPLTLIAPFSVVPHAGTWIEIFDNFVKVACFKVVPHAGTWIEIGLSYDLHSSTLASFPTRERGLK